MKNKIMFLCFVVFTIALLTSCKKENVLDSLEDNSIPPVITTHSNSESFKYTIVGTRYTKQEVYELKVVSDTVRYSIAATAITKGQMEVIVELKDGSKLITRTISGILAAADYRKLKSPLAKVIFNYSDFTGQFSFSINNVL